MSNEEEYENLQVERRALSARKRKMKKKKCKQEGKTQPACSVEDPVAISLTEKKRRTTTLENMIQVLGLDNYRTLPVKTDENLLVNVTTVTPAQVTNEPTIVIFPKRVKKSKLLKSEDDQQKKAEELPKKPVFNVRKARYEIMKFGITGFEKVHQEEAKIALAVSLGAKPPKRKYVNYKELLEQKKREKLEVEKTNVLQSFTSRRQSKPTARRKTQRHSNANGDSNVGKRHSKRSNNKRK